MNKLPGVLLVLLITGCLGFPQQDDYNDYDDYDGSTEIYPEEPQESKMDLPVFQGQSQNISVKEGEDVEISCKTTKPTQHILIFKKITGEVPEKETILYVGTMKVVQETRFENEQNVFKLLKVRRPEAGTYVCHYQANAENELRYVVDVQYGPSVTAKSPEEQRVEKGSSVTVDCQAKGNPKPTITWSKELGRLPSGAEKEEGFSMTLENVDRHVEGTYICTADNGIGDAVSASMKLIVEYAPEITTEKAIVRTGEGDKVELVCIVHARPGAMVSWSMDGNPLTPSKEITETDGGHRHSITISQVTEKNFGAYQCDAHNEKGENSAVINLTDLPRQPHFMSPSTSAEETSYTLVWETESYYPIMQYTVKYRQAKVNDSTDVPGEWIEHTAEVPETENEEEPEGLIHSMTHTITDLLPATDYQATVSVKNKYKWGDEGKFNFSTRKASPTTTTIATSTITSTSPPLAEEKVQKPVEETFSSQTTSCADLVALEVILCVATFIVSVIS